MPSPSATLTGAQYLLQASGADAEVRRRVAWAAQAASVVRAASYADGRGCARRRRGAGAQTRA